MPAFASVWGVIALLVVLVSFLIMLAVVPFSHVFVGGCLLALAVAILVGGARAT
jgi:hypothetical protein